MLIAKIDGDEITVANYKTLFPNVSFPASGPDETFLQNNNCMNVTVFKPHDRDTQKLVAVDPYIKDDMVYTVAVEDLTAEEIAAIEQSKIPQSVTRLQARLALIEANLWDTVTAYFQDAERTPAELAFFEDAQTWRRSDPIVVSASETLGLTSEQLDAMFKSAAQL